MPFIQECNVVEPPDAQAVYDRALHCLNTGDVMDLVLIASMQVVPTAEPFKVSFPIRHYMPPHNGNVTVEGPVIREDKAYQPIVVRLGGDWSKPATASLIVG